MGDPSIAKTPSKPTDLVIVGASGDLARKKIFPALFSLYSQDLLHKDFRAYGFARTQMDDERFREVLSQHLTCRYVPDAASCAGKMREFLSRCGYVSGAYDSADSFLDLYQTMRGAREGGVGNWLFYMAIPPFLFLDVAKAIGDAGMVNCSDQQEAFSRVVVEKPFGRDRESSDALVSNMAGIFSESQTFRIDHYLGKEAIQNLIVLRSANRIFEPIWNRSHISEVRISFQEDADLKGRGGYFERYGIIRDVMQNHLLQMLSLVAMELPRSFNAEDIRNEKVKVLRRIPAPRADDFLLGQYNGYKDEPDVPDDSLTPTFARAALRIENDRWDGVPFVLSAGKALQQRMTEIRIRFRSVPENIFQGALGPLEANELVIRVQPDTAIYFRIMNKTPSLQMTLSKCELDMRYASAFNTVAPEAYESLILDAIHGDKSLFIRKDELEAAWDIFTPALLEMENERIRPLPYEMGSNGPVDMRATETQ
jgi:glucose-6-phosphate 1-dehydrogenase